MVYSKIWLLFSLFEQMMFGSVHAQQGKEECGYGQKFNKITNHCDPCPRGFTGPVCDHHCTYPGFGETCSGMCECDVNLCNNVFGCIVLNQTDFIMTGTYKNETISKQLTNGYNANTISHVGPSEGRRETGPDDRIGTSSASLVSYITLALIGVFAVLFIVYLVSHSSTFISLIRRKRTTSLNLNENSDSPYMYELSHLV